MCSPNTPHTEVVQRKAEEALLKMARYLCGSAKPCEKHANQAKDLFAMAAQTFRVEQPDASVHVPTPPPATEITPEEIERSCAMKTRYRSPEAAGRAAQTAYNERGVTGLRVYPCPICSGFHLTKESLETYISGRG
jgi:hypothetical protein